MAKYRIKKIDKTKTKEAYHTYRLQKKSYTARPSNTVIYCMCSVPIRLMLKRPTKQTKNAESIAYNSLNKTVTGK